DCRQSTTCCLLQKSIYHGFVQLLHWKSRDLYTRRSFFRAECPGRQTGRVPSLNASPCTAFLFCSSSSFWNCRFSTLSPGLHNMFLSYDWSSGNSTLILFKSFIGYNGSMQVDAPAYTEEHIVGYPVEYIAGIDLYNAGEYHAAHDAWEERWMGPVAPDEKLFLQAMIQSAVAFHHLQIGRPGAARRMYLMAKEKFSRLNQ